MEEGTMRRVQKLLNKVRNAHIPHAPLFKLLVLVPIFFFIGGIGMWYSERGKNPQIRTFGHAYASIVSTSL
jgi:hypothetical protein